jgi:hypothetical protein
MRYPVRAAAAALAASALASALASAPVGAQQGTPPPAPPAIPELPPFAAELERQIPQPALPKPNAFDAYVAAGAAVRRTEWDYGRLLQRARSGRKPSPDEREIRAAAADAGPLLNAARAGFAHPYAAPPARTFDQLFAYYPDFRNVARAFAVQAFARRRAGDAPGAVRSSLDAVRMGTDVCRGVPVLGRLVGIGIQTIGRHEAWEAVPALGAEEAAKAAARMEALFRRQPTFAETMAEERWYNVSGLIALWRDPELRRTWQDRDADRVFRDVVALYDARVTAARFPYRYGKGVPGTQLPPGSPARGIPFLQEISSPSEETAFGQLHFKSCLNDAQNALLTAALGVRAYQARFGRLPDSLDAVAAADCLRAVPADPFSSDGRAPLCYRPSGAGRYVLYSVGPDGADDGGRPMRDEHAHNGARRTLPTPEGRGDIVAGVNGY